MLPAANHLPPPVQRPVSLDIAEFARFLIFQLLTAPMNVKFQQLLEYAFPAHDYRQPQPQGISQAKHKRDDLESQDKRTGRSAQWLPTQQHQPLQRRRRLDYWANTMAKWFLDCISLGMFVNTLAFLLIMGVLKGQSAHQISVNVQEVGETGNAFNWDSDSVLGKSRD